MKRTTLPTLFALALLAIPHACVMSQIPQTISLQGILRNVDGTVMDQGQSHMRFMIYELAEGGSPVWSETKWVNVVQGVFGTQLGSDSALTVDFEQQYYVTYQLIGAPEFSPRIPFSSVPTSLRSRVADSLSGGLVKSVNGSTGELYIKGVNGTNVTVLGDTITIDAAVGGSEMQWLRDSLSLTTTASVSIGSNTKPAAGLATHMSGGLLITSNAQNPAPPTDGTNFLFNPARDLFWVGKQYSVNTWSDTSFSHTTMLPGHNNRLHTSWASILGGYYNEIDRNSTYTTIVQGYRNFIGDSANFASVLNGKSNKALASYSTVVGGYLNSAKSEYSAVLSGRFNIAHGEKSTIVGGYSNYITSVSSFIGNGTDNYITGDAAGIVVGDSSEVRAYAAIIGAGIHNEIASAGFSGAILAGEHNYTNAPISAIVGGRNNHISISGNQSLIGAGDSNRISGTEAFIGAGWDNTVSGIESTIGAGRKNSVFAAISGISAGERNHIGTLASFSFIGAGYKDSITGKYSGIVSGMNNKVLADYSTVVGGKSNRVLDVKTFIGGGQGNVVETEYSSIVGGSSNSVGSNMSAILGGENNDVDAHHAAVVGGSNNNVTEGYGTILAGANNDVYAYFGVILGGENNSVDGYSSLAFGIKNIAGTAVEDTASIAFGLRNKTTARGAVALGFENESGGKGASAIGWQNEARGHYSFAAGSGSHANSNQTVALGTRARANHSGSVVICATNNTSAADTIGTANNAGIVMLAERGMFLTNQFGQATWDQTKLLNTSTGAYLSNGGAWTNTSDSTRKTNVRLINNSNILAKIRELSITEWEYKDDEGRARHIGPMAQQFHSVFGLGHDATSISTIDPAGVALSGIQALADENEELKERVRTLENLVNQLLEAQQ